MDDTSGTCGTRDELTGAGEPTALPHRLLPSYHLHPSCLTFYPFSFIPSHLFSLPLLLVQRQDLNEAGYATQRAARYTHVNLASCAVSFLCNSLNAIFFPLFQFVYASILHQTIRGVFVVVQRLSPLVENNTKKCAGLELRHEQPLTFHVASLH